MNAENIMKVFSDTAYIRVGGRPEEKKAAEYLRQQVVEFGLGRPGRRAVAAAGAGGR